MKDKNLFDRAFVRQSTALLAAMVIVVFLTAQVVHIHPRAEGRDTGAPDSCCSLCLATHSAVAPTAASNPPVLILECVLPIVVFEAQLLSQLHVVAAFIRPPPSFS